MLTSQRIRIRNQRIIPLFQADDSPLNIIIYLGESDQIMYFKALKKPQCKHTHTHNSQMQILLMFGFTFPVYMVFLCEARQNDRLAYVA